jgi:hypothetical protein
MKFKIYSRGCGDYREDSKSKLEELGFTFRATDKIRGSFSYWFHKLSEPADPIEINSLDELIAFTDKYGDCIISDGVLVIDDPDRS